jgi:hypothetical protein
VIVKFLSGYAVDHFPVDAVKSSILYFGEKTYQGYDFHFLYDESCEFASQKGISVFRDMHLLILSEYSLTTPQPNSTQISRTSQQPCHKQEQ